MLNKEKTINELKVILEGTSHLKIVYDGRSLVDNFKIKFGFDIQPIFDVMLAAAQFYCSEDVLKLRKVVKSVLGIDIDVGEIKEFSTRPLSQKFLHSFATRIAYLVPMYHKLSMKGFSFAFGNFSVQAASSFKDFHLSLSMTDSEKIEEQKRSGQLMTVDYSIFGEQSEESI